MESPSRRKTWSPAQAVGLLLALGVGLAWILLQPWRPLPFAGPEEAAALEGWMTESDPGTSRTRIGPNDPPEPHGARLRVPEGGASLIVLDAATHRPLERAELFALSRPPIWIGRTGKGGRIGLPEGLDPGRILVRRSGALGLFLGLDTAFCEELRRRAGAGVVRLALAPDPVTRLLAGRVFASGGAPVSATVTLFCLDPADPVRPIGLPPALEGAFRVSLAVEQLCRGAGGEAPWELGHWDPRVETEADECGRFAFRTLSAGPGLLRAATPSGLVARLALRLPVDEEVELCLTEGSWLRPVAPEAGRVQALCKDGWLIEGRPGEPFGPFLPGEEVRFQAYWPGGGEAFAVGLAPEPGEVLAVRIALPGARRIWRGRIVVLHSETPLAGITVRLEGGVATRSCGAGWVALDLGGHSGPVTLIFEGENVETRRLDFERGGRLPDRVELLPAGLQAQVAAGFLTRLAGRVLGPGGQGIAGALVRAQFLSDRVLAPWEGGLRAKGLVEQRTDSEGRFELVLPAPGEFHLEAMHLEHGRGFLEVVVRPRTELPEALLFLDPPTRLVGAVLEAQSGAPLVEVLVTCSQPGQPTLQVRTDPQGRFSLVLPAPGPWRLEVTTEGRQALREVHCAPAQTHHIQLEI